MKVLAPVLLTASVIVAIFSNAEALPRVDSSVHRQLKRQGTVNIIVTMRDITVPVLESFKAQEASYTTRGETITALVDTLERHASKTQSEITKLLTQEGTGVSASEVRNLWISNQVYFRDASIGLVEKLAGMVGVASIEEEEVIPVPKLQSTNTNATRALAAVANQWNVEKIGAPQLWAAGVTGQGVVVGGIDSGVRHTHVALKDNFRGEYGWYEPVNKSPIPVGGGHGTYTMGSIVASGGIGVAPGAKWISCRACSGECAGFPVSDIIACAQFMLCPTDPTGNNKDCSKAPHVVNNSYGSSKSSSYLAPAVDAWRAAGIIPVFANGNEGPSCSTTTSNAALSTTIGVGMTDANDGIASGSSRGPTATGLVKPDMSAPGDNVKSTGSENDTSMIISGGTSIAAPHVAGVVALLLSAIPTLTFDQVRAALTVTAVSATLKPISESCGGLGSASFPNNHYGSGRVDAFAAYKEAKRLARPSTPKPPTAGNCSGLDATTCPSVFLCSWNELKQSCNRWW